MRISLIPIDVVADEDKLEDNVESVIDEDMFDDDALFDDFDE